MSSTNGLYGLLVEDIFDEEMEREPAEFGVSFAFIFAPTCSHKISRGAIGR
jgi:hypothetical protein